MRPSEPESIPDPVDELVFQALERLEEEGTAGLDRFLEASPKYAADIRSRLDALRATGLVEKLDQPALELPRELGTYSVEGLIGEGGMGLVVAAGDRVLKRQVALKIVRPELMAATGTRERFQREGHAVAQLRHPGIVRVFEVGESEGLPFLAMERIDGCSLAQALDLLEGRNPATLKGDDLSRVVELGSESHGPDGQIAPLFRGTWPQACARVVREVAEALHHAHSSGVLHRDVKPSNIMLTPHGRVVLLDFGLAALDEEHSLTRTGSLVGSLPYTAPECISGDAPASVNSDIYALGLTLYELLTLRLPFRAASRSALVEAIVGSSPRPVSEPNRAVPRSIASVTHRAMARAPERRYSSAALLAEDLTSAMAARALEEERASLVAGVRGWSRRRPLEAAMAFCAIAACLALPIILLALRAEAAASTTASAHRSIDRLSTTLEVLDELRLALVPIEELKGTEQEAFRSATLARLRPIYAGIVTEMRGQWTGFEKIDAAARISLAETLLALDRETYVTALLDSESLQSDLSADSRARLALVQVRLAADPSAARSVLDAASGEIDGSRDPWLVAQLTIARARLAGAEDSERAMAADAARFVARSEPARRERATLAAAAIEATWSAPDEAGRERLERAAGELRTFETTTSHPLSLLSTLGRVLERHADLERRAGDAAKAAQLLKETIQVHRRIDGALATTGSEGRRAIELEERLARWQSEGGQAQ